MRKSKHLSRAQHKILVFDLDPRTGSIGSDLVSLLRQAENLAPRMILEKANPTAIETIARQLRAILKRENPALVFLILSESSVRCACEVHEIIRQDAMGCKLLSVIDTKDPELVSKALSYGITHFWVPPIRPIDVLPRLRVLLEKGTEESARSLESKPSPHFTGFVGKSPALMTALQIIPQVAKGKASVLITGETGTGKEICARAIHQSSLRSHAPFLPVNCGAIPCELMENELFGHDAGAYTGARKASLGMIAQADGGTLFLDEIDALSLAAQVKLLRFLQEREIRRLGSIEIQRADVRIIAASNANLLQRVKDHLFRSDFYYRLSVITIQLPPLRERLGDILLLADHFRDKFAKQTGKHIVAISSEARQKLESYSWPGNVRELENVMERAVLFGAQLN
jgi:two-component system, NtrC family, response regulator GlrR